MDIADRLNSTQVLEKILQRDSQRVLDALSQAQGAARSAAAALALLTWDILTTVDEEVRLIWSSEWTFPKALYVFVRYYSLASLTIQNVRVAVPCVPWLVFQIMSTFLVEAAVEIIIILRVYAVYAAQPKIMRIMLLGFGIQIAVMAISLGLSINKVKTGWDCKAADLPTEMVLYSTASIVYEAFLFGLMMYGVVKGAKEGFSDTMLLNTLIRDGAVAFIAIFSIMLTNTILFTLAPSTLVTLGFPWLLAILGSAGPRLILNLRAKHANSIGGPSSLTDLHFTIPAHFYSALNLDESPASTPTSHSGDGDEGEDAALNPSRSSSGRRSHRASGSGVGRSDVEAQTPPSPLSP
ncbi:hypothetical protein C8Q78DRAFT_1166511, partial [Trametes maxima]